MYSGNKNIKNTFLIKRYFATYIASSSSITIEIFGKVTKGLNLQISFSSKRNIQYIYIYIYVNIL